MRTGFSIKELAEILGIDPKRVGQSVDPAMVKLAKLWNKNADKTMAMLLEAAATLRMVRPSELHMSEEEIDVRICMAKGRYDGPNGPECRLHMADIQDGRAVHPADIKRM